MDQAFLFDVQTKISIATDSSPTDMQVSDVLQKNSRIEFNHLDV